MRNSSGKLELVIEVGNRSEDWQLEIGNESDK